MGKAHVNIEITPAMAKIAEGSDIFQKIKEFVNIKKKCVWGTCAGLILLSNNVSGMKIYLLQK